MVGYGGSPRATLTGALKIRGRSAANAVMNQEAVTDMVLQEEMVETSAQEKACLLYTSYGSFSFWLFGMCLCVSSFFLVLLCLLEMMLLLGRVCFVP